MRFAWIVALALLAAPAALAGDGDARLARVAETYGVAAWPAPGPRRAGVPLARVEAKGYARGALRVDPRVAEGRLAFTSDGRGQVTVTARLFDDARAARAALVARLATVQGVLGREAAAGEVAFGARDAEGRLGLLVGARGNVTFEVRATRPDGLARDAVEALALALDRALLEARPLEPGQPLPAPRVLAVRVTAARAGQPAALALDTDPASPSPAHVAFTCSHDAAVLETPSGWELMAPRAGLVHIEVWAASTELLVGRGRVTIEVLDE